MIYLLVAGCIIATALTRLLSFYDLIPAAAYLSLLPLFFYGAIQNFTNKYTSSIRVWLKLDTAILGLILMPILWVPFSIPHLVEIPTKQFIQSMIWDALLFLSYFSLRFSYIKHPKAIFYMLIVVLLTGALLIYLQQINIINNFYNYFDERSSLASFEDKDGQTRFRNSSFYGNWHDAGEANILLIFALYSIIINGFNDNNKYKIIALILFPFALFSLFLTSARAEIILAFISLLSWHFIISRFFSINNITPSRIKYGVILLIMLTPILIYCTFDYLENTIMFSADANFIISENRLQSAIESLEYLLSNPFFALFGWGMGTGGIAVVKGIEILPINVVDNIFLIIIANYGILGLTIRSYLIYLIMLYTSKIYTHLLNMAHNNKISKIYVSMCIFCLISSWCALLSFFIGESVSNRIYLNFWLLCLGCLVSFSIGIRKRKLSYD